MKNELDKLYQTQILNEAKHPFHFEKRSDLHFNERAYNPLCGDRFDLYFNIEEEKITDFFFDGFGCTISKAATSFMIRQIEGQFTKKALEIVTLFIEAIENTGEIRDESLKVFEKTENFKGRIDCILLSWKTMQQLLEKN